MPISPFLALNSRAATTPQLRRYVNATPSTVGVTFGTNDTDGVSLNNPRGNAPVVKFGGSQTFLAAVGMDIYRSTDGGASWASVKTFSAAQLDSTSTSSKSGLFVMDVAGLATAVIVTQKLGTANYFAHKSTDGTTWTTSGPFALADASVSYPADSVVWQGKLVTMWWRNNDRLYSSVYDPATDTMTFADAALGQPVWFFSSALCVFNDNLYHWSHNGNAGGAWWLSQLIAGVWSNLQVVAGVGNLDGPQCKEALFVDGAFMYAMWATGSAWKCYQFPTSLVLVDVSASVIPTALASGLATTQRMSVIVDERGVPGTAPTIWLYQSVDGTAGSSMNEWQWNGSASFIGNTPGGAGSGPNDSGGSARDNLPYVKHAQGTTYWTATEDSTQLVSFTPVVGGISVGFKMYSDAGSGTGSIRAWFGTATQEYPLSAATLSGTTTGLTKDNTTTYFVTWQAATDGFASGQRAKFVMEKF